MRFRLGLALWTASLLPLMTTAQESGQKPAPESIIIRNVTVIDGTDGPPLPNRTVVIEGKKILAILEGTPKIQSPNPIVVDGTDKFLIPGLWDMHVHVASDDYLKLFVVNGVTGIREMHAFFPQMILGLRKGVEEGNILGPRIVAATSLVDGPNPIWPGSLTAKDADEGRKAVQTLKKNGADFVKVYTKLPREAYLAIMDEARVQNLPVDGHVPESVSASEAARLGQRTMEHLYGIWNACSAQEELLRQEFLQSLDAKNSTTGSVTGVFLRNQVKAVDSLNAKKQKALLALLAQKRTYQVPTLTVLRAIASLDKEEFTKDERVKYMPAYIRSMWMPDTPRGKGLSRQLPASRRIYAESLKLVGLLHRRGVPILAGTDTTNPYCFPGFSLHDELALLVETGLTPKEALLSATRLPAECLGLAKECGTIEVGKRADVVLLEANPLEEIKNTRKIVAVCVAGRWLDRKARDGMLEAIAKKHQAP